MTGVLIFFHCKSNTGYAIKNHEITFASAAKNVAGDWSKVHFAYTDISSGPSAYLPKELSNIIKFDPSTNSKKELQEIREYISKKRITIALGFDQPVRQKSYKYLRQGGVRHLVSYWGAPMSSINSGVTLMFKKLDVMLARMKPELFVFQSEGMRQTAYLGRGISEAATRLVYTGIDTNLFRPKREARQYVAQKFGVPPDNILIYYSGHVNRRKGVDTLLKAAVSLVESGVTNVSFLLFGNLPGDAEQLSYIYKESKAQGNIIFGGYRNDLGMILPGCDIGVLATNEWDSYPVSTIEIASSGLPLIVADLIGVRETVEPDVTGLRFEPRNDRQLADCFKQLCLNSELRKTMGKNARERVLRLHRRDLQIDGITKALKEGLVQSR